MIKLFMTCALALMCAACANQRQRVGTAAAPAKVVASCIHGQMDKRYPNKIGYEEFDGGRQFRVMYNLVTPTISMRVMHVIVTQTASGAVIEVEALDAWKMDSVQALLGPCIDEGAAARI